MAAVSSVNIVIQKGTYFEEIFSLIGDDGLKLNLVGSTATAKLRRHPTAGIGYTFSTTVTVSEGTVKLTMLEDQTIRLPAGRCYYDVLITSPLGFTTKVLEGNALVEETASL